ncbi:hypothetical protein JZ751_004117 [Albula glossodonta]|uniref:Solute carrier family 22 member 23 n=1 Tax=Albula glossodonta TaxID=121402 RepID=A0A8T2PEN1_9TELE|nr:hypothetical protein JZ751_004117 [Albula glossodonta]
MSFSDLKASPKAAQALDTNKERIELCLPGWRFSMTMVANFVVLGGQLLMPGLAAVCRDWQVLQAVIICPFVLMLSYIWVFPESLRWLLSTQHYCRSKALMHQIANKNRVDTELDANGILIMDPESNDTTMFHSFYADYYTMAGIAVASCVALCPAVGYMGRRGGLLMFMIITALASLLQLGLLNQLRDTLNKKFSVAFSIIGMFSSHAVSNLSIFFCAEITPTVIRGGSLGLVLASAGFGMLTAPIMELHNQKGYFLHHVIFACCTLICIICILLLPETRHQPLPESLADGETYTRQPLLPPKKPGEQHLLLTKTETGRDYSRVQDTPVHQAAAAAAVATATAATAITAAAAEEDVAGATENSTANGVRSSSSS